jgi:hypothetical protein
VSAPFHPSKVVREPSPQPFRPFFPDLGLPLIDPVQINLIESEIAGCGRIVSVAIRSEIEMFFA